MNVGEEGTLHLEGSILLKDGCGGGAVLAVPPDHERQVRAHGDVDRLWLLAGRFALDTENARRASRFASFFQTRLKGACWTIVTD